MSSNDPKEDGDSGNDSERKQVFKTKIVYYKCYNRYFYNTKGFRAISNLLILAL